MLYVNIKNILLYYQIIQQAHLNANNASQDEFTINPTASCKLARLQSSLTLLKNSIIEHQADDAQTLTQDSTSALWQISLQLIDTLQETIAFIVTRTHSTAILSTSDLIINTHIDISDSYAITVNILKNLQTLTKLIPLSEDDISILTKKLNDYHRLPTSSPAAAHASDHHLISKQQQVQEAAKLLLDKGCITTNDYAQQNEALYTCANNILHSWQILRAVLEHIRASLQYAHAAQYVNKIFFVEWQFLTWACVVALILNQPISSCVHLTVLASQVFVVLGPYDTLGIGLWILCNTDTILSAIKADPQLHHHQIMLEWCKKILWSLEFLLTFPSLSLINNMILWAWHLNYGKTLEDL